MPYFFYICLNTNIMIVIKKPCFISSLDKSFKEGEKTDKATKQEVETLIKFGFAEQVKKRTTKTTKEKKVNAETKKK